MIIVKEDQDENVQSLRLHEIEFDAENSAEKPLFDAGSGYMKEMGFVDKIKVNQFICGFSTVADQDYLYSVRPVLCSF